jgi:hypothetical protein
MPTSLTFERDGIKVLKNGDEYTLIDTNRMPPSSELDYRYGIRCWSQQIAQKNFDNCLGTGLTLRLTSAEKAAMYKQKENA